MKIIDLLNMIANGEELPKKIIFENEVFKRTNNTTYKNKIDYLDNSEQYFLLHYVSVNDLTKEIEIIEEDKKIEKLKLYHEEGQPNNMYILNEHGTKCFLNKKHDRVIALKIQELIDKVNKIEEEME